MAKIESPCIKKCKLNYFDFCVGCGRAKSEIGEWLYLSDNQKLKIVKESLIRLKNAEKNN